MDSVLTLGIDDAGRGPVIGPMILAGVVLTHAQELLFKEEGVADSKILEHPTRVKLAKLIEKHNVGHHLIVLTAREIDDSLNSGTNLNTLEAKAMAEIINKLGKKNMKVIIDCPSINIGAWRRKLLSFVERPDDMEIVCEHKADVNYVSVSAASILAKVKREIEVTKLKRQYGNIGSGYPADPDTQAFLREHGKKLKDSGIFRTTWATWKEMFPVFDEKQGKLF